MTDFGVSMGFNGISDYKFNTDPIGNKDSTHKSTLVTITHHSSELSQWLSNSQILA